MNISIDIEPLLSGNRTGIGFYQTDILQELFLIDKKSEYTLNFFALRNSSEKINRAKELFGERKLSICNYFSSGLAKKIWLILPLPYRLFFREKADVSCFFNFTVPPFARGKKLVVIYDTVIKDFPETMSRKTKFVLGATLSRSIKRADKIVTISEFSKNCIMRHYGVSEEKISVIPCGFKEDMFNTAWSDEIVQRTVSEYGINKDYLLYLGTLEPRKNIERIVEAYAMLRKEHREYPKLVLAGGKGWLYNTIFERVKTLDIEGDVIFTGYVKDEDVPLLMKGAMAFCFPSLYEGFGMPPLEAMACGTPVITSNCSSIPEVVGDAAIMVDPYNVNELYQAMRKIVGDSELREKLSRKGLERCRLFSWKTSAKLFLETLENL